MTDERREYQRKYRIANKQRNRERAVQYYLDNREHINETGRKYEATPNAQIKRRARYHRDVEATREYNRLYRLANRERLNAQKRERYRIAQVSGTDADT
jgi:hypothetical protein